MKEFFNNFLIAFRGLKYADINQKTLFFGSTVVFLLLGLLFGWLTSVLLTALIGLLYELTYCYVPLTSIELFGRTVNIPDYIRFKNEFTFLDTKTYHKFESKNAYFCVDGIIVGIIIKVIFTIL